MTNLLDDLQAVLDVVRCAKCLTVIEDHPEGAKLIGPVGWDQLQEALARLPNRVMTH